LPFYRGSEGSTVPLFHNHVHKLGFVQTYYPAALYPWDETNAPTENETG